MRDFISIPTRDELDSRFIVENDQVVDNIGYTILVPEGKNVLLKTYISGTTFISDILSMDEVEGLIETLQKIKEINK